MGPSATGFEADELAYSKFVFLNDNSNCLMFFFVDVVVVDVVVVDVVVDAVVAVVLVDVVVDVVVVAFVVVSSLFLLLLL